MFSKLYDKAYAVAAKQSPNKSERSEGFKAIKDEFVASYPEDEQPDAELVRKYFYKIQKSGKRSFKRGRFHSMICCLCSILQIYLSCPM